MVTKKNIKVNKPIIIGREPPDLPPENLLIVFRKFLIISSRFGGSCLDPDPFPPGIPPPPPGGGDPQGDWFSKILSLKLMSLYIVTFLLKTS